MEEGRESIQELAMTGTMNVKTEYKAQVLGMLYPQLFDALARGAEGGEVTADDIIDFFGMGIAAILDNDSHLTTPRHLRIGADTAAVRIEERAMEFRAMQEAAGVSWLSLKLAEGETPQATDIN
jgi:hypothetical protein